MKTLKHKRALIQRDHTGLSLKQQCRLLGLNRSSWYYKPAGESALNLELMRLMDAHYLQHPYKGAQRMHTWLTLDKGFKVSQNRIDRLYYKVMGLRSILPGPSTSKSKQGDCVYPYLLRGLAIERVNQVWAMDITYLPLQGGFMYLVAIIDLFSRYVPAWSVSNTMSAAGVAKHWKRPSVLMAVPRLSIRIKGASFTSAAFTDFVVSSSIKMSMDGKGRCIDNVFIERLWWSVKYEDVYIRAYADGWELEAGLAAYFSYYNNRRRHQSLANDRPADRFFHPPPSASGDGCGRKNLNLKTA